MQNQDGAAAQHSRFGKRIVRCYCREKPPEPGSALELICGAFLPGGGHNPRDGRFRTKSYAANVASRILSTQGSHLFPHYAPDWHFRTFEEADEALTSITDETDSLLAQILEIAQQPVTKRSGTSAMPLAQEHCFVRCLSRIIELDRTVLERIQKVERAHAAWFHEFEVIVANPEMTPPMEYVLRLRLFVSQFRLATSRNTDETETDRYNGEFVSIFRLISSLFAGDWTSANGKANIQVIIEGLRYGTIPVSNHEM